MVPYAEMEKTEGRAGIWEKTKNFTLDMLSLKYLRYIQVEIQVDYTRDMWAGNAKLGVINLYMAFRCHADE